MRAFDWSNFFTRVRSELKLCREQPINNQILFMKGTWTCCDVICEALPTRSKRQCCVLMYTSLIRQTKRWRIVQGWKNAVLREPCDYNRDSYRCQLLTPLQKHVKFSGTILCLLSVYHWGSECLWRPCYSDNKNKCKLFVFPSSKKPGLSQTLFITEDNQILCSCVSRVSQVRDNRTWEMVVTKKYAESNSHNSTHIVLN